MLVHIKRQLFSGLATSYIKRVVRLCTATVTGVANRSYEQKGRRNVLEMPNTHVRFNGSFHRAAQGPVEGAEGRRGGPLVERMMSAPVHMIRGCSRWEDGGQRTAGGDGAGEGGGGSYGTRRQTASLSSASGCARQREAKAATGRRNHFNFKQSSNNAKHTHQKTHTHTKYTRPWSESKG